MPTLITGVLYLAAGLGRLGFFASLLSKPILTGYLNGIAIVIIVGQLPKLLGYPSEADEVLPQLLELVQRRASSTYRPRRSSWPCAFVSGTVPRSSPRPLEWRGGLATVVAEVAQETLLNL